MSKLSHLTNREIVLTVECASASEAPYPFVSWEEIARELAGRLRAADIRNAHVQQRIVEHVKEALDTFKG